MDALINSPSAAIHLQSGQLGRLGRKILSLQFDIQAYTTRLSSPTLNATELRYRFRILKHLELMYPRLKNLCKKVAALTPSYQSHLLSIKAICKSEYRRVKSVRQTMEQFGNLK